MIFKEAFELMKQGAKVKLPGWNGYWCWDNLSQASNSDIEKHLHEQDSKYFLKIIENQNKIISMLEESISTKK